MAPRQSLNCVLYVCMYVCMYKLYLMTVKTWLQSNLPRAVLLVKVSIEEQYIY